MCGVDVFYGGVCGHRCVFVDGCVTCVHRGVCTGVLCLCIWRCACMDALYGCVVCVYRRVLSASVCAQMCVCV